MKKLLTIIFLMLMLSDKTVAQYQVINNDKEEEPIEASNKQKDKPEKKVAKDKEDDKITGAERRGDKHYFNFAYSIALDYYKDALEEDSTSQELKLKIADCYKMLNDYLSADDWYHRGLTEHGQDVDPEYKLHFAQALSTERKYEESLEWFEEYLSDVGTDSRAERKIAGLKNIEQFFEDSVYYEIKEVSINSEGLDFSPMWFEEGVLFVSSRTNKPFAKSVFTWDQSSYLDLYYAKSKEDGDLEEPRIFHKKVNTKYHEGPLTFYNDQHNVVFTRNNYFKGKANTSEDGITKLKLYFADRAVNDEGKEDDWVNIRPFEFNNDEYSIGHPSITNDSYKMYFSSDMPGGFGETDIYVTYYKNGSWGQPQNLGPMVNTEGKEMFPYINGDYLYFSSDGLEGLGGLDLFRATLENEKVVECHNLGHPMSSSFDDFSLIIDEDDHYGYFSTNRDHTVYDNLYYFVYDKPGDIFVEGTVIDNRDSTIIASSMVKLMNEAGEVLKDTLSDAEGNFKFRLGYKKHYKLKAGKLGYNTVNTDSIYTKKASDVIDNRILKLERPQYVVSVKAVDMESGEVIFEPAVKGLNVIDSSAVSFKSRESKNFDFIAYGGTNFNFSAAKDGYFANNIDASIRFDHKSDTLFFDIPLEKIVINKAIELENIYYDLDKSFIRPDAAIELDKLVKILVDNPTIKIELGSHTDSRGSDRYNMSLSQRRAASAVKYIEDRGIADERIVAKGYGETALVNGCSNGVECSKEDHQRNRRTEFKVTSY